MPNSGVDASDVADGARDASQQLSHDRGYGVLVAVGLVSFGVVHLLIAWIALRIAWAAGATPPSRGRLRCSPLALWQVVEAVFGHGRVAQQSDEAHRTRKRLASAGPAVVYLLLGISALRLVLGAGSSGGQEDSATSRLMGVPLGRVLVVVVAAAILAVGVSQVLRGRSRSSPRTSAVTAPAPRWPSARPATSPREWRWRSWAGLFAWAAVTYQPKKAGGLDAALHTVGSQPLGSVLLTVLALGFAAFGLYCFV